MKLVGLGILWLLQSMSQTCLCQLLVSSTHSTDDDMSVQNSHFIPKMQTTATVGQFRVDDFVAAIVDTEAKTVQTPSDGSTVVEPTDEDSPQNNFSGEENLLNLSTSNNAKETSAKKSETSCCDPVTKTDPISTTSTPQGGGGTNSNQAMRMALDPVQSDFLALNIKRPDAHQPYNIHVIPTVNGKPVQVEISVSLRNILEIDEHKQLVTLETTLRLYWRDPRLKVDHLLDKNSSDSAYVLLNPESANFIWFPDIYIDFAKALRLPTVVVRPASLRIYRNSTARYATQINYDVACPMKFHKYPYDTQTCKVKYESYGHTIERMRVTWKKGFDQSKVTENNSISLAQFEYAVFFEENYEEEIASGVYPGVIMTLLLRRKISYHLLQTYLPSGLFVIVAWLSLFLPPESIPGRVTMAMTTLLTLAAMFGAVRQSTPKVSYVSALDVWMCTCIIFVFFALLEYVVVLCLINNCQVGGGPTSQSSSSTAAPSTQQKRTPVKKSQLCRRHSYLAGVAAGIGKDVVTSDVTTMTDVTTLSASRGGNNGVKVVCDCDGGGGDVCCGGNETVVGRSGRAKTFSDRIEVHDVSESRLRKRVGLLFCCPTKAVRKQRLHRLELENYRESNKRRKLYGCTSGTNNSNEKNKRPFQNLEKTCSITMAVLFITFNIFYWPWLLTDDDFDYAKFELNSTVDHLLFRS